MVTDIIIIILLFLILVYQTRWGHDIDHYIKVLYRKVKRK